MNSEELMEILAKANKITLQRHGDEVSIERAIFLSWWCDKGDCKFCYMSSQKPRIKKPEKAKRKLSRILAEAEICKRIGANIEFLSGGYGLYKAEEIKEIAELVAYVYNSPIWLNVGVLPREKLEIFGKEIEGITGAVETFDRELHSFVCPSKPLKPIIEMLMNAKELGFKTGITIILGLGENISKLEELFKLIEELELDRITFYSLNPHEGTYYENSPPPASLYQAFVIAKTRLAFPEIKIISGTWIDQLPNIGITLIAGANGITKFPLFSMFGNRYGRKVEEEVKYAGRKLKGTFTDVNKLLSPVEEDKIFKMPKKFPEIREEIDKMVEDYIKKITSHK